MTSSRIEDKSLIKKYYSNETNRMNFCRSMKSWGGGDKQKSEKSLSNSRSTEEERGADAPALGADEGRDKLRKATGSRTWAFDPWVSEWGNPAVYDTATHI